MPKQLLQSFLDTYAEARPVLQQFLDENTGDSYAQKLIENLVNAADAMAHEVCVNEES